MTGTIQRVVALHLLKANLAILNDSEVQLLTVSTGNRCVVHFTRRRGQCGYLPFTPRALVADQFSAIFNGSFQPVIILFL